MNPFKPTRKQIRQALSEISNTSKNGTFFIPVDEAVRNVSLLYAKSLENALLEQLENALLEQLEKVGYRSKTTSNFGRVTSIWDAKEIQALIERIQRPWWKRFNLSFGGLVSWKRTHS